MYLLLCGKRCVAQFNDKGRLWSRKHYNSTDLFVEPEWCRGLFPSVLLIKYQGPQRTSCWQSTKAHKGLLVDKVPMPTKYFLLTTHQGPQQINTLEPSLDTLHKLKMHVVLHGICFVQTGILRNCRNEPQREKTCLLTCAPKCALWSASSLSAWRNIASLAIQNEHSEDSDLTA